MTNGFRRSIGWLAFGLAVVLTMAAAAAQQTGQQGQAPGGRAGGAPAGRAGGAGRGGTPPALPWAAPALPDGPILIQSAEPVHRNLRITVIKGLSHPWGMVFLPDGNMLITERAGSVRVIRNGVLDPKPVAGVPAVAAQGLNGLLDIALHPRFAENRFVYLTYHKPIAPPSPPAQPAPNAGRGNAGRGGGNQFTLTLARGTWDGTALTNVRDIFNTGAAGSASRIVFGRDGMIYMSSGNATEGANAPPQDPNDYRGKVLRLRDDGTVPPDNPFVGRTGYKPEIYSMGHRTQLGMAVNPETGDIWAAEQGPNGGDEINIIQAGKNYGWPLVSQGRSYPGPRVFENPSLAGNPPPSGLVEPHVVWIPSIALSGMTFYTGERFPSWKRNVFVGGLRQGESPRTGQLQRIVFNDKWEELRREPMLREFAQRIRDVRQGPDGYFYVLTEENDAALLRIEPGEAAASTAAR